MDAEEGPPGAGHVPDRDAGTTPGAGGPSVPGDGPQGVRIRGPDPGHHRERPEAAAGDQGRNGAVCRPERRSGRHRREVCSRYFS